ncbi:IS110 family transposase, partial [Salinibacter ruber]|uniref:IS110 family transposase n=1 Tax=Salinibacter ruber TaxID=146919 RepID=UPI00311A97F5
MAFSLGIDVGKEALEVALRGEEGAIARTTVANDSDGHDELLRWLSGRGAGPEETSVCMEASGDFEKVIAQRLYEEDYRVIPNAEDHYTDWTVTDGRIAVAKKFHLSCTTS